MRLIVTRPEEDAGRLTARLEELGHEVVSAPLLAIVPREGIDIPDLDYQLAVATSANGIRSLRANEHVKSLRMLTVGPQSLAAARQSGFTHAEARGGDAAGLAAYVVEGFRPDAGPILYLSGAETSGDLQGILQSAGFEVDRVTLYDARPASSLGRAADWLRHGAAAAVLLYSPRTARIWAALADAEDLTAAAARPLYLCLSQNVADALPTQWRKLVAKRPEDAHMLALLDQIAGTR